MATHTLLGGNGTIATELIPILQSNGQQIRIFSRNAKPVAGAEIVSGDVLNRRRCFECGERIRYCLSAGGPGIQ